MNANTNTYSVKSNHCKRLSIFFLTRTVGESPTCIFVFQLNERIVCINEVKEKEETKILQGSQAQKKKYNRGMAENCLAKELVGSVVSHWP